MLNFAEQIADALDILKFDGAVQDTLAELRGKWGAQVPALLDERFDAVGVQYTLRVGAETESNELFDKSHGFYIAVIQGFFRDYYYTRGSAFSFLVEQKPE